MLILISTDMVSIMIKDLLVYMKLVVLQSSDMELVIEVLLLEYHGKLKEIKKVI